MNASPDVELGGNERHSDAAQADQIKEGSSAGRERTDVRDRLSSGPDAELGGNERQPPQPTSARGVLQSPSRS
jgi:hypothetical protein